MLSEYVLSRIDDYSLLFTLDILHECMSHKVTTRKLNNCPVNRKIINKFIISEISIDEAIQEILKLPRAINALNSRLRFSRPQLIEHMKLYLSALHEDSSFEITPDFDPTVTTQSFKVVARRSLKEGTKLYKLCARLAVIDRSSKLLKDGINDFSILKIGHLHHWLLGPLSFVNHRCQMYNAAFTRKGTDKLYATLIRDVSAGEEITVTYGPEYFQDSNKRCLCLDCVQQEMLQHNKGHILTRSSLQPLLELKTIHNVSVKRRIKVRKFPTQKKHKRPSSEIPFPGCPGATLIQNIPIKVLDHILCRRQVSMLVQFLCALDPIWIHLETLLALIDGARLARDYMEHLLEVRSDAWLELVTTYPSLDPSIFKTSCKTRRETLRPLSTVKVSPNWCTNLERMDNLNISQFISV